MNMAAINRKDDGAVNNGFLASILNSINLRNPRGEEQLYRIRSNKVINYVISLGYQFINIGSWFPQTRYNRIADQNINVFGFQFPGELSTVIGNNSILRLVILNRYFYRKAVLKAFDVLNKMPLISGKPKFIMAHIICPHGPYVFGANGEKLGLNPGKSKDEKELYVEQHVFITKKVSELINEVISSSKIAPVIIIQADHGARMDLPGAHQSFSAIHIPSFYGNPWPDSIPSSDTFRLLFDELFGARLTP